MRLTYYCHGRRDNPRIALTFDDGPNPNSTPAILKILKQEEIRGSFFLLGKAVAKHPKIAQKIIGEGHIIGNHTYSHTNRDWVQADRIIKKITGIKPLYCRAPYLARSFYAYLSPSYLNSHKLVHFDVDSYDWKDNSNQKIIFSRTSLLSRNGSIIDFHDGSEQPQQSHHHANQLINVLPKLIRSLKQRYSLVGIDELDLVPTQKDDAYHKDRRYPNVTQKLIIKYRDQILLLHHSSGILDFPGGRLEYGESLLDGLNRELQEELSLQIKEMPEPIHVWNYISKDKMRHSVMIYYYHHMTNKPRLHSEENHDYLWLSRSDMKNIGFDDSFIKRLFLND